MDTLSHGLWALAIFWGTSYRWWAFLVGALPDLLSFGLYFVQRLVSGSFQQGPPSIDSLPKWVFTSYDVTHSFVTWALVGVVLYFFARKAWPVVFAAGAHVALDIATHCTYFPTPYLWPLPHPSFCGVSWAHPVVYALNWLSLAALFVMIGFYDWKRRKERVAEGKNRKKNKR